MKKWTFKDEVIFELEEIGMLFLLLIGWLLFCVITVGPIILTFYLAYTYLYDYRGYVYALVFLILGVIVEVHDTRMRKKHPELYKPNPVGAKEIP